MPEIRSPPPVGLEFERAPRLRRLAALVDEQAHRAIDPARARKLARDMRLRAAELELGVDDHGHDQADPDPEIEAIAFALDQQPRADGL